MSLLGKLIKVAHEHPEIREHLVPIIKEAMEFDSPEALKKYLKEHPDADKSKHKVKKPKKAPQKDSEAFDAIVGKLPKLKAIKTQIDKVLAGKGTKAERKKVVDTLRHESFSSGFYEQPGDKKTIEKMIGAISAAYRDQDKQEYEERKKKETEAPKDSPKALTLDKEDRKLLETLDDFRADLGDLFHKGTSGKKVTKEDFEKALKNLDPDNADYDMVKELVTDLRDAYFD